MLDLNLSVVNDEEAGIFEEGMGEYESAEETSDSSVVNAEAAEASSNATTVDDDTCSARAGANSSSDHLTFNFDILKVNGANRGEEVEGEDENQVVFGGRLTGLGRGACRGRV